MSHIFDALQRAETERSGVELNAFDVPTELLEIAESAVKMHAEPAPAPVTQVSEPEFSTPEAGIPIEIEKVASQASPWDRFESLPVALLPYSKLVSVVEKDGLAAEKFRFLAVRLRHLQQRRALKQLLITSTMPEEGKSTVAANLACTLGSRRQQKTLLLEGDLRRPTLLRQLGMGKVPGLSDYLQGTVDAKLPIYRLDALGIWVMPAGHVPPNPLELMQCGRLSPLMEKLSTWFDWVVIDSPPILPLADTSVWTRLADGILLVTRQGTTDKEQLKRGLEAIEPSKLLGAILNSSRNVAHSDYYQRYGHEAVSAENKNFEKQG
ncbi:MAG: CpsD/CapB family tyrosine-protein kinase [Candidatus Sulfotelmatobacter sp.]